MNLNEIAENRYSTKEFDPDRTIAPETFEQIKALLRKSPSSVNSQPWHFILADTPAAKRRMVQGTQGPFQFNEAKVLDASHSIVFCVKNSLDDDYLQYLLDQEEQDGRFTDPSFKEMMHGARTTFANIHRNELNDTRDWMEKQVYLNMGTVLLGAAALGIDAVAMEGIDAAALDKEFGLSEKGYRAIAIVSFGYRKETDFNASLPKSRLPETDIFTVLD